MRGGNKTTNKSRKIEIETTEPIEESKELKEPKELEEPVEQKEDVNDDKDDEVQLVLLKQIKNILLRPILDYEKLGVLVDTYKLLFNKEVV